MRTWLRRRLADPERGSTTIAVITGVAAGLLLVAGLVIDGGGQMRSIENANAAAHQAARIAGQHLSVQQAQTGGGLGVNTAGAVAAAEQALAVQEVSGTVQISGDQVTVTTHATYDTVLLSMIGINQLTGTGSATVRIADGPTGGTSP